MTPDSYTEAWEWLIEIFTEIPVMTDDSTQKLVLDHMHKRHCELHVRRTGDSRTYAISILDAALEQKGALQELCRVLRVFEKHGAKYRQFAELTEKLLPSEIFELEERFDFIQFVRSAVPHEELSYYYHAAMGESPPVSLADAGELVSELEQALTQPGCHPLVLLTETIAQKAGRPLVSRQARDWSDRMARYIDDTHPERYGPGEREKLTIRRQKNVSAPPPGADPPTLTLMLEPRGVRQDRYGATRDKYLFSATLYRSGQKEGIKISDNDDPIDLEEVETQVIDALRKASGELFMATPDNLEMDNPTLEFVLPRTLLSYPVEEWRRLADSPSTLDYHFIVVIREFERHIDPGRLYNWLQKWRHVMNSGAEQAFQIAKWITCADPPTSPRELDRLLSPAEYGSLGLTYEPRRDMSGFGVTAEMIGALDAGTPIVIWPRWPERHGNGSPDCTAGTCPGIGFKTEFSSRLDGLQVSDLPRLVRQIRRETCGAPASPQGLTLLWDDPRRLVKPLNHYLDAPEPRRTR